MKYNISKKKYILISIAIFIFIFGIYKLIRANNYNKLVNSANFYMDEKEYDKAIAFFMKALNYKNDNLISNNILLAEKLKEMDNAYNKGLVKMKNKNYIEAIEEFNKINDSNSELYKNAQNNIAECKKQYSLIYLNKAKDELKKDNLQETNMYLDMVLKVDTNNEEAKRIKNDFSWEIGNNSILTRDEAVRIAHDKLEVDDREQGIDSFEDLDRVENGVKYYFVEVVSTGGHGAASAYFVNSKTGKIYETGSDFNTLVPYVRRN